MANHTGKGQFQPGQSGNPGGRPKNQVSLVSAIRAALREKGPDGITYRKAIALRLVELARKGDLDAIRIVMERIDGKVPEARVLQGDESRPIPIRMITYEIPAALGEDEASGG